MLLLLVVVAVLVTVSRLIRVPYPILLLVGGLALGLVPAVPHIELDPEIVFLLILPPLLYVTAFLTPVRDFRANLTNIASLAVGLVIASAVAVAAVAIAERLAVPRRVVSILEGESLVNDATALTLYRGALAAATATAVAISP